MRKTARMLQQVMFFACVAAFLELNWNFSSRQEFGADDSLVAENSKHDRSQIKAVAATSITDDGVHKMNGRDFSDDTAEYISAMFAPVVILTVENFKNVVQNAYDDETDTDLSGPVMMTFFSPTCPHCRKFMPLYAVAARYFYEHNPDRKVHRGVAMFGVDCNDQPNLCDFFQVRGYPTIYHGTQKEFIDVFDSVEPGKYIRKLSGINDSLHIHVNDEGFLDNGPFYLVNYLKTEYEIKDEAKKELDELLSIQIKEDESASDDDDDLKYKSVYKHKNHPNLDALLKRYKKENEAERDKLLQKMDDFLAWKASNVVSFDNVDGNDLIKVTREALAHLTLPQGEQKRQDLKAFLEVLATAHPQKDCMSGAKVIFDNFDTKVWPPSEDSILPSARQPSDGKTISLLDVCKGAPEIPMYRTCMGSQPYTRGYTCALWSLFHTLAANYPKEVGYGGRMVLTGVYGYIRSYFTCLECRNHFVQMAQASPDFNKAYTKRSVILWLWWAHNRVNLRLAGEEAKSHAGDPYFPKKLWPSISQCEGCYVNSMGKKSGIFNHEDNEMKLSMFNENKLFRFVQLYYKMPMYGGVTVTGVSDDDKVDLFVGDDDNHLMTILVVVLVVVIALLAVMFYGDKTKKSNNKAKMHVV